MRQLRKASQRLTSAVKQRMRWACRLKLIFKSLQVEAGEALKAEVIRRATAVKAELVLQGWRRKAEHDFNERLEEMAFEDIIKAAQRELI